MMKLNTPEPYVFNDPLFWLVMVPIVVLVLLGVWFGNRASRKAQAEFHKWDEEQRKRLREQQEALERLKRGTRGFGE